MFRFVVVLGWLFVVDRGREGAEREEKEERGEEAKVGNLKIIKFPYRFLALLYGREACIQDSSAGEQTTFWRGMLGTISARFLPSVSKKKNIYSLIDMHRYRLQQVKQNVTSMQVAF